VKRTCARLQWRKSASLEAEILVFRHQLNVLSRSSALLGASARLNGKAFFVIFPTV
jgi:hypothetical protein